MPKPLSIASTELAHSLSVNSATQLEIWPACLLAVAAACCLRHLSAGLLTQILARVQLCVDSLAHSRTLPLPGLTRKSLCLSLCSLSITDSSLVPVCCTPKNRFVLGSISQQQRSLEGRSLSSARQRSFCLTLTKISTFLLGVNLVQGSRWRRCRLEYKLVLKSWSNSKSYYNSVSMPNRP